MKPLQIVSYVFAFFVASCGMLGWVFYIGAKLPPNTIEYQSRLKESASNIEAAIKADGNDDSLKMYAVYVSHNRPFKKAFIGFGIYLGQGAVITAAHVVGRWPSFTRPHVLVAGQYLPARVIKEGTLGTIDLALLSIDQKRLPIVLRLRRNPLCTEQLAPGLQVVDAVPTKTTRTHIIPPLLVVPQFRKRFYSLIDEPMASGSGIFDAHKKCLLGIVSRKITKLDYRVINGRMVIRANGFAGYFVSPFKMASFLPPEGLDKND